MSFVPSYQWLTEKGTPKCGGCDKVYIDDTINKEFQVSFTPTQLIDDNFSGNNISYPMEQIYVSLGSVGSGYGSGLYNGIIFDIDTTVDEYFINSFSFFYEGVPHCFVFRAIVGDVPPEYISVEYGNFTLITISSNYSFNGYLTAFNIYMNPFGIEAISNGTPSIVLYNFPDNTMVEYNPSSPITDGIGSSTWGLNNFLPINNELCFFNTSELGGLPTAKPSILKSFVVPANKRMIFTVDFTNSFLDELTFDLIIRDNTYAVIDTISKVALKGSNTLQFNYTASSTPPSSYIFEFAIYSTETGEVESSMVGFCFNNIHIEYIGNLESIASLDCNGEYLDIDFTTEYNDRYNDLVTIQNALPSVFSLIIADDESNTFTSITYEQISALRCKDRNFIRFKWWSDCQFANLDYKNLPFVNDVWLQGYSVSLPVENKEVIVNALSSGEIETIYSHSLEKTEFNIGLYTQFFYKTLQRAFMHKFITIDGLSYTQDSDSKLTKKPENDSKYTAKIELIEVGSAVVSTSCCD